MCFACVGCLVPSRNTRFIFLRSQRPGDSVRWAVDWLGHPSQPSSWRAGTANPIRLHICTSHHHLYPPVGAITDSTAVAVNDLSSGLIDGKLSGILGLAFQGIANTKAVPFWQALIANNLLTNPEFSFFLTRFVDDQSAAVEEPGGVFTLGGTNSTLFQGDIDFRNFSSVGSSGSFWLQTVTGAFTRMKGYEWYD